MEPLADGDIHRHAAGAGRQVDDLRHLAGIAVKDLPQPAPQAHHRLRRLPVPMDGQHRPRLQRIQHPLRAVGRRVPEIQVHPPARRGLRLGGEGVE